MKNRAKCIKASLVFGFFFILTCGPDLNRTNNVTGTDNVTGTVVSVNSAKVSGAKISLFLKKAAITSPDETVTPVSEVYSNEKGEFSFNANAGSYTIVATADSESAFRDNITPGSTSAQKMLVMLEPPGAVKGEIINSLELRGTGSIVVHLIGTAIFKNVDSDGKFLIDNIPAGKYTLVSYSTYQPEFSPNYRSVTVFTDSTADLGKYSLTYNGIPIPKNIKVSYDTAHQVVKVSWDSIKGYNDFQEYVILRGEAGLPDHNLKQIGYTQDTDYFDTITFSSEQPKNYEYCVLIHNKLGEAGKYYGIYSVEVMPYKTVLPKIDTITVLFDTLKGIAHVAWNSVKMDSGFGGYQLIRTIVSDSNSTTKPVMMVDTIDIPQKTSYSDSLFKNQLSFSDSTIYSVSYSICVYQKDWKLYGRTTITNAIELLPYYGKIPVVNNPRIQQDTLNGTLAVSWDSLQNYPELDGFSIIRTISNVSALVNKNDTLLIKNKCSFIDTIYPKYVDFAILAGTTVTYTVAVKHKTWGITGVGKTLGATMYSYQKYKPTVFAGANQNVDISTDVVLAGSVLSSTWHIKKQEWKIGSGNWVVADSGKTTFKTNSNYSTETIVCMFRATDSAGNMGIDTMNVVKQQMVVTFGQFPSKYLPAQGTMTVLNLNFPKYQDKFWMIGPINQSTYQNSVFSTKDFVSWTTENVSPGFNNYYSYLLVCNGYLYYLDPTGRTSYKSNDGISWTSITPNLPYGIYYSTFCALENKLYVIGNQSSYTKDTLFVSEDGITWNRIGIPLTINPGSLIGFNKKLYLAESGYTFSTKRWSSSDYGLTWTEYPMWDSDYASFPDNLYGICSNDSVLIASYEERPAGVKKVSMLKNGVWSAIPIAGLGTSSNYYENSYFLFDNRLMCISRFDYSTYSMKSIKLY